MTQEMLTIKVEVMRLKGENQKGKYDFLIYQGYDKKGKKCRFKFTKAVTNRPSQIGYYVLEIDPKMMNKDKTTRFNEFWIKEIKSVKPYEETEEFKEEDLPF